MAQLENSVTLYCVLCSAILVITVHAQFEGSHYLPYGSRIGPTQQEASGPHVGGQQPGTGTGRYPQFPPPERPRARPRPARPPSRVTPRPIAPKTNPPLATERPVVNPVAPVNPAIPTGVAGSPRHTIPPVPTEEYGPIIPVTRRREIPRRTPFRPRPHPRFTQSPVPCYYYQINACSNRGMCVLDPVTQTTRCQCRDLYAGERCELELKPPKNITMVDVSSTYVSISWIAPPVANKRITGFVVQYNRFGDTRTKFSPNIHPGVTDYTLRDLEPESQYTICINIIFKNLTTREAVLRDQCLEIRTQPDVYRSEGISWTFMALIIGAVILVLIIIMVMALCIQRRCIKPIREPIQVIQRAVSRRSVGIGAHRHLKHNRNQHNHLPMASASGSYDQEAEACVKVHRIPPDNHGNQSNPFLARLHTNNGNNSDYKDWALPVSVNYTRLQVPDIQPPKYTRSSSLSQMKKQERPPCSTSRERTELSTFGHHRKNQDLRSSRSMPPYAMIRALPPSVSNHVMRSKNAREKDASKEFDMKGSYMYFSGQNITS